MKTTMAVHRRSRTSLGTGVVLVVLVLTGAAPSAQAKAMVGGFKARCAYTRSLADDPIVHPGDPGASHLHDFFGNKTTTAATTTESLQAGPTTCQPLGDHSAYWVPSLYNDGTQVAPLRVAAYYNLNGRQPGSIVAFPTGLRMIAGDSNATSAQPATITDWSCLPKPPGTTAGGVPTCDPTSHLLLRVTFPDCWDGLALDSPDHRSHMAVSEGTSDGLRHCPATHPQAVPQLALKVEYPIRGGPGVTLSSGGQVSGHADFWNAWVPDQLSHLVDTCLNTPTTCD
ncbi:MAG: DUF1996 domain-containing protein [Actinomycetota bacterium]|nr:DUF1996 domain-containing protein [Actinomycetota bacterium]